MEQIITHFTDNAYAYSSMTNGDSFAKKFAKGDWFKLTVSWQVAPRRGRYPEAKLLACSYR